MLQIGRIVDPKNALKRRLQANKLTNEDTNALNKTLRDGETITIAGVRGRVGKTANGRPTFTDLADPYSTIELDGVFNDINIKFEVKDGIPKMETNEEFKARLEDSFEEVVATLEQVDPQLSAVLIQHKPTIVDAQLQVLANSEVTKLQTLSENANLVENARRVDPNAPKAPELGESILIEQKFTKEKGSIDNKPPEADEKKNANEIQEDLQKLNSAPLTESNLQSDIDVHSRKRANAILKEGKTEGGEDVAKGYEENSKKENYKGEQTGITTEVVKAGKDANQKSWPRVRRAVKWLVGLGTAAGVAAAIALLVDYDKAKKAEQTLLHQREINGCFLRNKLTGATVKVKTLSCGKFDLGTAIEACTTQNYSSAADDAKITECPDNTFNPCAAGSRSRSADSSVPLVPNVCDQYVYKGTAPAAVTGIKLVDACKTADGKTLPENRACSDYCKTENFNLPPAFELYCISVDYATAYADLMSALGYDPEEIFPPSESPPSNAASGEVSKPLIIAASVTGVIFLILLVYYFMS